MIVARNPGSAKKATSYAERLRLGIAVIHGEQKESDCDMVDGRNSPPPSSLGSRTMNVGVGVPQHPAKEKPPINVVGDVGGRIAIMVVSKKKYYMELIFIVIKNTVNEMVIKCLKFCVPWKSNCVPIFITCF